MVERRVLTPTAPIPFVWLADGARLSSAPSDAQLLSYVWSQIQNPLAFGYFEIAHARAGEITHDAQNGGMFAAVFGFRIVIDFVGVGWPSTGLFGAFGRTRLQRLIDQYQYERMKLVQANPVAATSTEIKRAA